MLQYDVYYIAVMSSTTEIIQPKTVRFFDPPCISNTLHRTCPVLQCAAKLALQALYMLRQIPLSVRPSVRLSVTLRYCVKMRERRAMRSTQSGNPVSSFLLPRMVDGDDPVQVKFESKEVDPSVKTAELYTFRLITPEP